MSPSTWFVDVQSFLKFYFVLFSIFPTSKSKHIFPFDETLTLRIELTRIRNFRTSVHIQYETTIIIITSEPDPISTKHPQPYNEFARSMFTFKYSSSSWKWFHVIRVIYIYIPNQKYNWPSWKNENWKAGITVGRFDGATTTLWVDHWCGSCGSNALFW